MADEVNETTPTTGVCLGSHFAVDKEKVEEGAWVDCGEKYPALKGLRLLIARANNPKARAAMMTLVQQYGKKVGGGSTLGIDPAALDEVTVQVAARHVLLGWSGNLDSEGREIQYTPARAERALRDYPDFRDLVSEYSGDFDLFRAKTIGDAGKNSEAS